MLDHYDFLISTLLNAEGNSYPLDIQKNYTQTKKINIPHILIPLLYAASNIVQISTTFLPYYYQQFEINNTLNHQDFIQTLYPEMLKFLLQDIMHTQIITEYKPSTSKRKHYPKNIFLYDSKCIKYPPFYGIDITKFDINKVTKPDTIYYLIGDISPDTLEILIKKMGTSVIFGITPQQSSLDNWQDFLKYRLNYFSKTIMAGSINIQLPLIEYYFQVGLAPISFYYLLFRHKYYNIIVTNALCLLNNKTPHINLEDHLNYQRLNAHTDIKLENLDKNTLDEKNYLYLLSFS